MRFNDLFCFRLFLISVLIAVAGSGGAIYGQISVSYKNYVRHADGNFCYHIPPNASFSAYLNNDQSKVLFETAPQWQSGGDPNISGNGVFSIELGNFANPPLAAGDSVFVRFTCLATGQQGVVSDSVIAIPWLRFPQTLFLSATAFPARPQDLALSFTTGGQRMLSWTSQPGVSYSLYRRSMNDTLPTGDARMLYTRIAGNIAGGSYTDTTTSPEGFGYVLAPASGNIFGPPSEEVNDLPAAPQDISAILFRLNPLQVKIAWQVPPGPGNLQFRIYRADSSGVPITANYLIGETGEHYFLDEQVAPEETYYYKVAAANGAGVTGDPSEEAHLRTAQPQAPAGFQVEVYMTEGIDHPSGMVWAPDGRMFICEVESGEIKIIEDNDQDGFGDTVKVFAGGFEQPVGLAWKGDSLYVSSRGTITIVRDTDGDDIADDYQTIISGWPCYWHQNNQLIFDAEGYFFVALGAWEDRTTGPSIYNNTIMRISPDGSDIQIWAGGIRNVYDLAFSPQGRLFGGDNGWQEQTPGGLPEELNYYAQGRDYGYPAYLGYPPPGSGTFGPLMEFPDHTAPAGVLFYTGDQFPAQYRNDLYLAFYGPDNFDPDIYHKAYRIVRCEVADTVVTDTMEFASHFYRPVDILQDSAGAMYVADLGQFWPPLVDGHIYKITYTGSAAITETPQPVSGFHLGQNYPNPFNPTTAISYQLSAISQVKLAIYNLLGQKVRTLVNARQPAGNYDVKWDGRDENGMEVSGGIYFYRLSAGSFQKTRKMVLLR